MNSKKLSHAVQVVSEAGYIAMRYFNQLHELHIEEKKKLDFVSNADISVEKYIIEALGSIYPKDGFIGEESEFKQATTSQLDADRDGYWVIDPIDGTSNFINHINYWCISVAYYDCRQQKVTLAIIHQPCLNKLFASERGAGVYLNGVELPRIDKKLDEISRKKALIGLGTGTSVPLDIEIKIITFVKSLSVGYRKLSCCALMLTEVVTGSYRGYFEPKINSWDCLAGLMMIEELGGITNDFLASTQNLLSGNVLLAGTPEFYPTIKPLLAMKMV
ncbi:inositol-1-monophosphatase [Spirochaetota bacterium]|nr:inositol-1-monophosphatase [Spirochaetota bacterium]